MPNLTTKEHPLKVQLVGQGGQLLGGEIGHKTASFHSGSGPLLAVSQIGRAHV